MVGTNDVADQIAANWKSVGAKVREATVAAGRAIDSVSVIGVSKYVDATMTKQLFDAGCEDLGESRPQVLWQKAEFFKGDNRSGGSVTQPRWHMIGHVQTNKLRRLLRYQPVIHSVDSERLLRAINDEACHQGKAVDVLLEVNISGDDNKTGLSPEKLAELFCLEGIAHTRILGLMAMAGWRTERKEAEDQFHQVRSLRDELESNLGLELPELSMGMSGDFREAIRAGATMVRIGSSLFEGLIER